MTHSSRPRSARAVPKGRSHPLPQVKNPKTREIKVASQRTIRLADKILRSDGVAPARLQVKDGAFWTLQWSELRALALLLPSRRKAK
jgi:hypothetical protein